MNRTNKEMMNSLTQFIDKIESYSEIRKFLLTIEILVLK